MPRRTPSLALAATAALLCTAVVTVAGPATAAAGPDKVVVTLSSSTGTPGLARTGTVTVTEAGQPVSGKDVTLEVDRGFVTAGEPSTGTKVGDRAGYLAPSTSTVRTNAQGVASFQLGIGRDAGFDDDGAVTTVVTARADAAAGSGTTAWSSADPLNGGSVDVVLSPRQDQAVAPTVSGDRTWYDVVTRDQFGNAVAGAPLEFFPTGTSDVDYSDYVESNLDSYGDFWVVSNVPGTVTTKVTWVDAPTYRYSSTTGQAAKGQSDVDGSTAVSYYDVAFGASRYTLGSSADGNVAVGTTVTKTVTVLDQLGRPVRGLDVQFFRFGPDAAGSDQKADRETNALGQASYSFVGSGAGTAKVTAVVTDGLSRRTLTSENGFRFTVAARVAAKKAKASAVADKTDVLKVSADKLAAGAAVSVYELKRGKLKPVKAGKGAQLGDAGKVTLEVKDRNGKRATSYVVVVQQTPTTFSATSAPTKVR